MFKWLSGGRTSGMEEVEERFVGMLSDGRHVFYLAMSARIAGADPSAIEDVLLRTEERTDEAERAIRRRVMVHASTVAQDVSGSLMYMSIAKDAERIADLSKALFDIAKVVGPPPEGDLRDDLAGLRDSVSLMIAQAAQIFADDNLDEAHQFIARARELQEWCNVQIEALLDEQTELPQPAASALTYRHTSRILANLLNIVSSVVMPLDQMDYPTTAE